MNDKIVQSFRVKKKLLGGYKVVYKCPHCRETLTSQESEIRDEEQCPECEMSFYISDEAANRIELLRAKEEEREQKASPPKLSSQFFIKRNEKAIGPFSIEQIQQLVEAKKLRLKDELSISANGPWRFLKDSYQTIYPKHNEEYKNQPEDPFEAVLVSTGAVKQENKNKSEYFYSSENDKSKIRIIEDKKSTQSKPRVDYDYRSKKDDGNDLTPTNYIGITIAIAILISFMSASNDKGRSSSNTKSNNYSSSSYDSSSPYAPSPQTRREIDRMSGTAAQKSAAKDAVRRFNEAAAKRGERPTGL